MAVRLEKVVLDLEDRFASGMVKDAAAVALLRRELDNLSGSAVRTSRSASTTERDVDRLGGTSERSGRSIDKLSGRLALFTAALGAVGPATVPIGALAVPAVAGLANQFGIAALAAGTLVGSMQGIGDAVSKLEKARIAPTDASVEAARVAMAQLSSEGREFALAVQSFLPTLRGIRDAGGAGWFPGLTDALQEIEKLAPRVEELFFKIGQAGGDIARDSAISLTSKRWRDFFDFLGNEAPPIMRDLSATAGDLAHGMAELWMAFDPVNDSFSSWFRDAADSFDGWASGLSKTQGFQEFVAYLNENGPRVGDALGSIGNALLQIVEAAAPLGGPTLEALARIADVVAKIADSDLGTPILLMWQMNSIMKLLGAAAGTSFGQIITGQQKATLGFEKAGGAAKTFAADLKAVSAFGYTTRAEMERSAVATERLSGQFKSFGRTAALVGGLAVATSGLGDSMGYSNTASMALLGTMVAPGWGTALGVIAGATMDAAAANDDFTDSMKAVQAQLDAGLADPGSADVEGLTAQVAAQRDKFLELKNSVTGFGWFDGAGSPAGLKNDIKGWLGTSDVEAAKAAYDKGAASLERLQTVKQAASRDTGLYRLYQLETEALEDNISAMRAKRAEAARGLNAELDYKASLLDAKDALKANGKTVDENTRAGQANLRALYGIATAWNGQTDAAKNAQGSLKTARANFIQTAESMGMAEDKAKRLADRLFEIPPSRTTKINMETDKAAQKIRAFQQQVDSLRDGFVTVHVNRVGGDLPYASGGQHKATGGRIVGPGGPTEDRVPVWASNGEYMIRAAAVQHYGVGFFDRVNAMRLASGGPVGDNRPTRTSGLQHELDSLQRKIKQTGESIDKERERRDRLRQSMDQLSSGVAGNFLSSPFGRGGIWGGGGWESAFRTDIAQGRSFLAAEKALRRKGLNRRAFEYLVQQGPMAVEELAGSSRAVVDRFERLYGRRQRVANRAGGYAAEERYGDAQRESNGHLRDLVASEHRMEKRLHEIERTLKHIKDHHPKEIGGHTAAGVNKGARAGLNDGRPQKP